jgi:hypothetical protein
VPSCGNEKEQEQNDKDKASHTYRTMHVKLHNSRELSNCEAKSACAAAVRRSGPSASPLESFFRFPGSSVAKRRNPTTFANLPGWTKCAFISSGPVCQARLLGA